MEYLPNEIIREINTFLNIKESLAYGCAGKFINIICYTDNNQKITDAFDLSFPVYNYESDENWYDSSDDYDVLCDNEVERMAMSAEDYIKEREFKDKWGYKYEKIQDLFIRKFLKYNIEHSEEYNKESLECYDSCQYWGDFEECIRT